MRVAASTVDITPDQPLCLFGYSQRKEPFDGIHSRLEANVITLSAETKVVVLVGIDSLFSSEALELGILQVLQLKYPSFAFHLIVYASHTHFAPALDPTKPKLGLCSDLYVDWTSGKLSEAILNLLESPSNSLGDCQVQMAGTPVPYNVSRRRQAWGLPKGSLIPKRYCIRSPNPNKPIPQDLKMAALLQEGQLVAVIWTWPCHNVIAPELRDISAGFPAAMRDVVRERLGRPEMPVVYIPGAAGDLRYNSSSGGAGLKWFIRTGGSRKFSPNSQNLYDTVCRTLTKPLRKALDHLLEAPKAKISEISYLEKSLPLDEILETETQKSLRFQHLQVGPLRILGISAELCSGYQRLLEPHVQKGTWISGYAGQVFGYLPTQSDLGEGGYECEGFKINFSLSGAWKAEVEQPVIDTVAGMQLPPSA